MEVNPLTKREIGFSKDYKKVPVVVIDGVQVNDSTAIIDAIEAKAPRCGRAERAPTEAMLDPGRASARVGA